MYNFVCTFEMLRTCLFFFFYNYKKYLLIFFVFYYTFFNPLKTLSTQLSRFGLKYYIASITISGKSCGVNFWIMVNNASIIETSISLGLSQNNGWEKFLWVRDTLWCLFFNCILIWKWIQFFFIGIGIWY